MEYLGVGGGGAPPLCISCSGQWTKLFYSLKAPHCNEVPSSSFFTLPSGPQQPSGPRIPCPRFLACWTMGPFTGRASCRGPGATLRLFLHHPVHPSYLRHFIWLSENLASRSYLPLGPRSLGAEPGGILSCSYCPH